MSETVNTLGEHKQWYDAQFEHAQLSQDDMAWLSELSSGTAVDESWLLEANKVVALGSIDLRKNTDPETVASVYGARMEFYGELLGWDSPESEFHRGYLKLQDTNVRVMPLVTFIASQRVLAAWGIGAANIVRDSPTVVFQGPKTLETKLRALQEQGLVAQEIMSQAPAVLSYKEDVVRGKVSAITNIANDPTVISRNPEILTRSLQTIQERIGVLEGMGVDVRTALSRYPNLLDKKPEQALAVLSTLQELGFAALPLVNAIPSIFGMRPEKIHERVEVMQSMGLDAVKIVSRHPNIFWVSKAALQKRFDLLHSYGLNAAAIFNAQPNPLTSSVETLERKINGIQDLGLDHVRVIEGMPSAIALAESTTRAKVENLTNLGLDAVKIVNKDPVLIATSADKITSNYHLLHRYAQTMHWKGSVKEMVEAMPTILKLSPAKLRVHARLFAAFGSPDFSQTDVNRLLVAPLSSHMMQLRNHPKESYTATSVARANRVIPRETRDQDVAMLLQNPEYLAHVGHRVVAAYKKYAKLED